MPEAAGIGATVTLNLGGKTDPRFGGTPLNLDCTLVSLHATGDYIGSGAMIGGLILGIAEALSSAYLSTEYKDVVSFALLILVLLVMPTGILGRPEVEKV